MMTNWFSKIRRGGDQKKMDSGPAPSKPPVPPSGESQALAVGETILKDYLVEKELGRGGMGRVWLVKSNSTGRRFAVKQTLLKDERHRKAFLAELQTWIDLPEHPNIVPCRFFHTVGDEIVIFADYVEGGSLADWIVKRRLTSLEQILDIAIQFAWGLHAIHERGLLHQDVKPGNVLMTAKGVPMVTDFGLARARLLSGDESFTSPAMSPDQQSVLVSSGGMTPAYASPEQRAGQPLSRKTDIWSWGVSVLDMFMGGVSCPHGGYIAGEVLEAFMEDGQGEGSLPPMPKRVGDILRKCFAREVTGRWPDLSYVGNAMTRCYDQVSGQHYMRIGPTFIRVTPAVVPDERHLANAEWRDPREWLNEALFIAGRDAEILGDNGNSIPHSAKGAAIRDIMVLCNAERIFKDIIGSGRQDLKPMLGVMYRDLFLAHMRGADLHGAVRICDCAISIWREIVNNGVLSDARGHLASSYMSKGIAVKRLGDLEQTLQLYDKAISLWEMSIDDSGKKTEWIDLATAYLNKALLVEEMGDFQAAQELIEKGVAIRKKLFERSSTQASLWQLAAAHSAMASLRLRLKDYEAACKDSDDALSIFRKAATSSSPSPLWNEMAATLTNKAIAVESQGHLQEALAIYCAAIQVRERLVTTDHLDEFLPDLAGTYLNAAAGMQSLGYWRGADDMYGKAGGIYQKLVVQEGRQELANELARTYMNRGIVLEFLGDLPQALEQYDHAIKIRERLVAAQGRTDLANDLAGTYLNKGLLLQKAGAVEEAVALFDKAITIRQQLVFTQSSAVLGGDLANAYLSKAMALKETGRIREALKFGEMAVSEWYRIEISPKNGKDSERLALAIRLRDDLAKICSSKGG